MVSNDSDQVQTSGSAVQRAGGSRPSGLTPEQMSTRGRIGAYALHASRDSREHLAPARRGFMARFEREVDPDGVLEPGERARRAHLAMRAHMASLALRSSRARRKTA